MKTKKFKISKKDEQIVDDAIKRVKNGPKEKPRPRRPRAPRPLFYEGLAIERVPSIEPRSSLSTVVVPIQQEISWGVNMSGLEEMFVQPIFSTITMSQAQHDAENRLAERLSQWFPFSYDRDVRRFAEKLRREAGVIAIASPASMWPVEAVVCIGLGEHVPQADQAVEISYTHLVSLFEQVQQNPSATLIPNWGSTMHTCMSIM